VKINYKYIGQRLFSSKHRHKCTLTRPTALPGPLNCQYQYTLARGHLVQILLSRHTDTQIHTHTRPTALPDTPARNKGRYVSLIYFQSGLSYVKMNDKYLGPRLFSSKHSQDKYTHTRPTAQPGPLHHHYHHLRHRDVKIML